VPPPGVEPVHVTHPSTNRARRRVTSLIQPTLLPLRHAMPCGYFNNYRLEKPIMEILSGAKNGVHTFGYNSTESEPIWMKSRAL